MLKNDLMHSHLKVRSACKKLIHAVNDNPSVFNDLEICHVKKEAREKEQIQNIGFISIMILTMSKLMGFH